jgi:tRNA (guanine37-N1)-methyltransferase
VTLRIDVITLFPGLFPGPLAESIPGRAMERGLVQLVAHDLRRWGLGRHRSVDDYPYGGGAGMVLRPEPIAAALAEIAPEGATRILLDPGGRLFDQALCRDLADRGHLVLICPRYEGVDHRVRSMVDLELSIGDYVLSGGELPALVVIDAVTRLVPGVIDEASPVEESFSAGLLEYPQYTRPPEFEGRAVPPILLSGHHGEVARWRQEQALERTRRDRPDLIAPATEERTERRPSED